MAKPKPVRVIVRAVAREGEADKLKVLLRSIVLPTRGEQDCWYYELLESNQPGLFYFHELWSSQEALDAHANSVHFKEVFGRAEELLKEPVEVNLMSGVE